jgi:hypothetical protein
MTSLRVLDELGLELERAIEERPARARPSRRMAAVGIACVLAAGAGGAFAAGLLLTGAPVRGPSAGEVPRALSPLPATAGIAPLRVDDPYGGPPWGLRLARTAGGQRCVAAGRIVDGKLAAPGKDGRFHALPLTGTGTCGDLRSDPIVFDVAAVADPDRTVTVVSGQGTRALTGVTVTRGAVSHDLPLSGGAFVAVYRGGLARPPLVVVAHFGDGASRILYRETGR